MKQFHFTLEDDRIVVSNPGYGITVDDFLELVAAVNALPPATAPTDPEACKYCNGTGRWRGV